MNESICLLGIKNEKKGLATKTPRREKERKKERKKRKGVVVVSFRRQKRAAFCARGKKTHETQKCVLVEQRHYFS